VIDLGVRLQVERVLTQLVEIAVDVNTHVVASLRGTPPADYRGSFTAAGEVGLLDRALARRLEPSAGLRDVVVHQYLDVDLGVLAAATGRALEDYGDYVRAVARWFRDRQETGAAPS
jgi:uncharacterized protein YutE (UPF0331/DUF86 family)